jgi:hypothetical protein
MNILQTELPLIKYITTNEKVDFYLNGHKVFTTLPNVCKDIGSYIALVESISLLDKYVVSQDRLKFTEAHRALLMNQGYPTSINTSGFDNFRGKLMYRNVLGLKIVVS